MSRAAGAATAVRGSDLPVYDFEIGAFIEPWATTAEERQESIAAVKAYMRGDLVEVDEYLKRRHRRWNDRARFRDGRNQDGAGS